MARPRPAPPAAAAADRSWSSRRSPMSGCGGRTRTSCRARWSGGRRRGSAATVALRDDPAPTDADLRAPGVKLVNFWASWCGPCRVEHPLLTALAGEGIPVIGVNYKDEPEKALAFLAELGDPYAQDRGGPERADRARLGDLRGAGDLRRRAGRDDPRALPGPLSPASSRSASGRRWQRAEAVVADAASAGWCAPSRPGIRRERQRHDRGRPRSGRRGRSAAAELGAGGRCRRALPRWRGSGGPGRAAIAAVALARLIRSAAAAAKGASARMKSVRPASSRKAGQGSRALGGGGGGAGAEDQRRDVERQHQDREQQAAAADADGQRRADGAEEAERPGCRRRGWRRARDRPAPAGSASAPRSGAATTSGRPVVSQCASAFSATSASSGSGDEREDVERAVLEVGLEQPVERRAGRRAARRSRACRRRRVASRSGSGPMPSGTSSTTIRKKPRPSPAPPPERSARRELAAEDARRRRSRPGPGEERVGGGAGAGGLGRERRGRAPASRSSAAWVAIDRRPPAAQWARIAARSRASAAASSDDGRLVEQPEPARREEQPREAEPALLAGRAEVRRPVGERRRGRRRRARRRPSPPSERRPEREVLGDGELRLDRVEMAGVGDALGAGVARRGAGRRARSARSPAAGRRARAAASTCRRRSGRAGPASRRPRARSRCRASTGRPPRLQERSETVRPMRLRLADRRHRGKAPGERRARRQAVEGWRSPRATRRFAGRGSDRRLAMRLMVYDGMLFARAMLACPGRMRHIKG